MNRNPNTQLHETAADAHFNRAVRQALNESSYQISPARAEQLRSARAQALAAQKRESASIFKLGGALAFGKLGNLAAFGLPALALALGLTALSLQHEANDVELVANVETKVLASEVPIDALLDKGFVQYVQHGE